MQKFFSILLLSVLNISSFFAQENILWKFQTNGRIYSTPLLEAETIFFGSADHHLYAVEKKTGKNIWKFKTGGAVHSSPVSGGSLIIFGSADGNLYALDKENGRLVWKFSSEGEKMYDLWDYYLSSPLVDENKVYWGSGDGNLYVLDLDTGKLKWNFKTAGLVHASPVINGDRLYLAGFDGKLYSIDKNTGENYWTFQSVGAAYFPKGELQKAPLVKDGSIYIGSRDYNLYVLDEKTGRGKWNYREPKGWIIATPHEYQGKLYFGTSDAHVFYCMNKESGEILWKKPLQMRVYGSAVTHKNLIFFGTFDGKILALDPETGTEKWQFQTPSSRQNYSGIFDEKGHFREGFELYGPEYEKSESKIHSLGSILGSPVFDGDVLYFGSSDGYLYAVGLPEFSQPEPKQTN